jgi:hypothetical protein
LLYEKEIHNNGDSQNTTEIMVLHQYATSNISQSLNHQNR